MATPRLKEKYVNEVRDQLFKELGLTNVNQIPRLEKIVIKHGCRSCRWRQEAS